MQSLDKKAILYIFLSTFSGSGLVVVVLLALTFVFGGDQSKQGLIDAVLATDVIWVLRVLLLCVMIGIFGYAWLCVRNWRYELRNNGFYFESGIITKRSALIPFNQIQNIDVFQSPLHRILNLAELRIQTAGLSLPESPVQAPYEGFLPAVAKPVAERLRNELLQRHI